MRSPLTIGLRVAAIVSLAASPIAAGHGLLTLNVQVPPTADCPEDRARCLASVEPQPVLHPGDHVDLLVWNDDDEAHSIHVAANRSADPAHDDTPAHAAIASVEVPANASRDAGSFTVPEDARALYVWCDLPGHEAAGAWMRVPLTPTEASNESPLGGLGALGAALAGALAIGGRVGRWGQP